MNQTKETQNLKYILFVFVLTFIDDKKYKIKIFSPFFTAHEYNIKSCPVRLVRLLAESKAKSINNILKGLE